MKKAYSLTMYRLIIINQDNFFYLVEKERESGLNFFYSYKKVSDNLILAKLKPNSEHYMYPKSKIIENEDLAKTAFLSSFPNDSLQPKK